MSCAGRYIGLYSGDPVSAEHYGGGRVVRVQCMSPVCGYIFVLCYVIIVSLDLDGGSCWRR